MIDTTFIISTILGLPALAAGMLSQAEFWQRKEYRFDRARAALMSPELAGAVRAYIGALMFVVIGWVVLFAGHLRPASIAGLASLAIFLFYHARRAANRGIFHPQPTTKSALLLLTTSLLTAAYLWRSSFPKLIPVLHWATVILLMPVIVTLAVNIVNLSTDWRKHQVINQAVKHRRRLTKLKVIGLTGSYGKTSAKHFLSQILPGAVVSREHRNSEFSIAQDMLEQLSDKTKIYVAEMGAYRRGEIKDLVKLIRPQVGLITAIGNQHLATFGSFANIVKAKWELIENLPADGIAVLSADDDQLRKRRAAPAKTIYFSTKKPADVYAENVVIKASAISCRFHLKDSAYDVEIPLAGQAALSNVVAAAAVAHALGVDNSRIVSRLKQLNPYPRTMEVVVTKEGSQVIDDSYSANERGVLAAIKHLDQFPQSDKRVVLTPLIELGREARTAHWRIGRALAESGAVAYIYGNAYWKDLLAGAGSRASVHFIAHPLALIKKVAQNLSDNTVILLEGRIPEVVRKNIVA